jgi:hypothetical protein
MGDVIQGLIMKPVNSQEPESDNSARSDLLTPAEIESLRQDLRQTAAYLDRRWAHIKPDTPCGSPPKKKPPLASIRTSDGMRFYVRDEADAKRLSAMYGHG